MNLDIKVTIKLDEKQMAAIKEVLERVANKEIIERVANKEIIEKIANAPPTEEKAST